MTKIEAICKKPPYDKVLAARNIIETQKAYANDFIRYDKWLKGADPTNCTVQQVEAFIQGMVDKPYSGRTLQRQMSTLHLLYKHLVKSRVIPFNPTEDAFDLFYIKIPKRKPKALTQEQRKHLKASLKWDTPWNIHISLNVSLGLYAGLRRSEIRNLKWEDINFTKETLYVIGKGSKESTLPIPKPLLKLLRKYKNQEDVNVVGVASNSLMGKWNGMIIKKWCGWGKEVQFSCHVLRHSFITELAEQTDPPIAPHIIQSLARHGNFNTTKDYIKTDENALKKAMDGAFK